MSTAQKDREKPSNGSETCVSPKSPHGVMASNGPEPTTKHELPSENPTNFTEQVDVERTQRSDQFDNSPPYTIFSHREKAGIIVLVSFLAIISPFSTSIYFPALTSIADDLDVSISLVNLTVTTYLVSAGP